MRPRLRKRYLLVRLRRLGRNNDLILILLSLVIGVAAGAGSVLFRDLILLIQDVALSTDHERLHVFVSSLPWWRILLATTLGGLGRSPRSRPGETASMRGICWPTSPAIDRSACGCSEARSPRGRRSRR